MKKYTVDGFTFGFDYDQQFPTGKVVICPSNVNPADPKFIAAFQWAIDDFDCFYRMAGIVETVEKHPDPDWWYARNIINDYEFTQQARQFKVYIPRKVTEFFRVAVPHAQKVIAQWENPNYGFVYLIRYPDGIYKIGCSADPKFRIRTLSKEAGADLERICVIETDNMWKLERDLHVHFDSKRRGMKERFALDASDIDYIKSLAQEQPA